MEGYSSSERVVKAVAEQTDTDPLQLPTLYAAVDPDALDELISEESTVEVRFEYAGCKVTVNSEQVNVEEIAPSPTSEESSVSEATN